MLQKQKEPIENNRFFSKMAERGGFEPPDRINRSTDFESAAFDHSATSPLLLKKSAVFSFISSLADVNQNFFLFA